MITQFVELVREYVNLIETLSNIRAHDFLMRCAILLPQIYAVAHQLPKSLLLDESSNKIDLASEVNVVWRAISQLLGEHNSYFEVFDPLNDEEAIPQTISDDLAGIYNDLKTGLIEFDLNTDVSRDNALWEWRFGLENHFGDHLVDVLRPIQRLVHYYMELDYVAE